MNDGKCGICGVVVSGDKCSNCGALKYQIKEKFDMTKKLPNNIIQRVLELQNMED